MKSTTKRTLLSITVVAYLLAACAPAQAATQDPALVQQFIEDSVALTVAAEKALATEPQAIIVANSPTVGFVTVTPGATKSPSSGFVTSTPQATESPTQVAREDVDGTMGLDIYCEDITDAATQQPQLPTQVTVGDTVTIQNNVNLRSQPSRLKRIVLILKPGTQVKIIDGPVTTRYGAGSKYVWWKVELPGGLTGWAAEVSVCGRYYFMEPAE